MYIYCLFVFALLCIFFPRLWRYQIKPYFGRSTIYVRLKNHPQRKQIQRIVNLLHILYAKVHAEKLSRRERKRLSMMNDNYIYGEIEYLSFILLLEKINPQPGEVFYDLGSGSGKPVFVAALSYDLSKACGIEYLPALSKLANKQLNKMLTSNHLHGQKLTELDSNRLQCVEFINDDFLQTDFIDGDIFFINATCLNYYTWEAVVNKLLAIKIGSRVIVTTKKILNAHFETVYQGLELMSWGMNSVNVYRKIL